MRLLLVVASGVVSLPVFAVSASQATSGTVVIDQVNRILPLDVVVNGAKMGTWLLVERNGEIYAPADAFSEWRVQLPPDTKPIDFRLEGQAYYPLSAIPGYKFKLDSVNQIAQILFSPEAFAATQLTLDKSKKAVVSQTLPSIFFNYDWNYQTTSQNNAPGTKDLGLLSEIGVSGSYGVLTSSQVGRNLTNDPATGTTRSWVRMETTYTRDFPDDNRTLRLGDSTTHAGMWGRNVYFGGIQFGSNFALTPGFISQPIPLVAGTATAPSTVEMYVNNVLRQTSNVPTGPFAINNAPILTGSGDVKIVTTDILGRQTVIEQSFYTTADLLAAGLNDWSVEAGRLRSNLGLASNDYGPEFASGTWRHGYSNSLTLETRAEASPIARTLGFGMVTTLPMQTIGKAALAVSNSQGKEGGLWLLGLQHQSLRTGLQLQVQGASQNFRQLGQDINTAPVKLQWSGNWSYAATNASNFGIGFASISRFDNSRISTVSGNYSTRIGRNAQLTVTASRALYDSAGTSLTAFFTVPLGGNTYVNAQADKQDSYIGAWKNPDAQSNLGWRVLAGRQNQLSHEEAGLNYLGRYGQVSADASTTGGANTLRIGARGGLVLADSSLFATQYMNQSFAIVDVPGYRNVGIGLANTTLAHTDSDGTALVPNLMPYQYNPVRLNPDDLPVSAELDTIEQYAVPAWRSGVKVTFPVRGGQGALLTIVLEDGQVAPAGAIVQIEGDKEQFYVARRGEAFVTGLQASNHLLLDYNGQKCRFDVTLPPSKADDIPRVGPLVCKGIAR